VARTTLRRLIETPFGTEWSRLVRTIHRRRARHLLIVWNRGLGDIALGLAGVISGLRGVAPDADITVLTRADLADAFALTPVDHVLVDPELVRGIEPDVRHALARAGSVHSAYDLIIERPDPTHWFRGQARPAPRLAWPSRCNALSARFDALFDLHDGARIDIAVHVQSETGPFYNYRKDWPVDAWQALFERIQDRHPVRFVLFGHRADRAFERVACVDLRGQTSFLEMMSVIKNRCLMLIAPDSGVLTMTYYLDVEKPIDIVSLWADPRQGILKQATASPNPLLRHRPLLAPDERIEHIDVDTVARAVEAMLEKWGDGSGTTREVGYGLIAQ
jgi:ADP-heptose:LPS heptosyltransferase